MNQIRSDKVTNVMDDKNITSRSYFKQTKNIDIHADMYGTYEKITQSSFSLGLMEAGIYHMSRVMKGEYEI